MNARMAYLGLICFTLSLVAMPAKADAAAKTRRVMRLAPLVVATLPREPLVPTGATDASTSRRGKGNRPYGRHRNPSARPRDRP